MTIRRRGGKELPVLTEREKTVIKVICIAGFALAVIFWINGVRIFQHRQQEKTPVSVFIPDEKFMERKGFFGYEQYIVSVQTRTDTPDGNIRVLPLPDCQDLLVVDLKYPFNDREDRLRKKLTSLPGVVSVQIFHYRIVIHRPCPAARQSGELWTWNEVWNGVHPVLREYFTNLPLHP